MSRLEHLTGKTRDMSLDIVSYGRRGPSTPSHLSPDQVAQVARTVHRTPAVMVKVSGGARDAGGARAHFDYVGRHGRLDLELDDGRRVGGKGSGAELAADWNLDLSRGQNAPATGNPDRRPKVVHNIVLSMSGRISPEAVLRAARSFARENFGLQYRYAMVLHTDQAHPHVHLIVKAEHEYEPGKRLTVRKATLRQWREDFARQMRVEGIAANATPRAMRGKVNFGKKDAIHQRLRAVANYAQLSAEARSGPPAPAESTFMRAKVEAVAHELKAGTFIAQKATTGLLATRRSVTEDWTATAAVLRQQGEGRLADDIGDYLKAMPRVQTEQTAIATELASIIANMQQAKPTGPSSDGPEHEAKREGQ